MHFLLLLVPRNDYPAPLQVIIAYLPYCPPNDPMCSDEHGVRDNARGGCEFSNHVSTIFAREKETPD
jgi:hypothetical protein